MPANKDKQKQGHTLHIRPSDRVRQALSKAAAHDGRSLAKEIERRLEASLEPAQVNAPAVPDALVYGWSNPGGAKALGDAIGMLAGQIEDVGSGPSETPWQPGVYGWVSVGGKEREAGEKLALLKVAIARVLDALGASTELSPKQATYAEIVADQFISDFRRVDPDPAAYSQRRDFAVMAHLKHWLEIASKSRGK